MPAKKRRGFKVLGKFKAWAKDRTGRMAIPGIKMARRLSAKTASNALEEGIHKGIHGSREGFSKKSERGTITGGQKKVIRLWGTDRRRQSREVEIESRFRGKRLRQEIMDNARAAAEKGKSYKGYTFDKDRNVFIRESHGITTVNTPMLGLKEGTKTVIEEWNEQGEKLVHDRTVFRSDRFTDFQKTRRKFYRTDN